MRHTNHALTFLRQHYRAVLKHAYALGIATVIVLSLGSATANTETASTKVTDQQTADALLNNWKSEYQIQIDSKHVDFQSGVNITIASKDNFIKATQDITGRLSSPNSSIELNGENASFEIGSFSSLKLDQFTLTKGTLTIDNGTLDADLNMNGGTFIGSLQGLCLGRLYDTKRKITFTHGGNFITSDFNPPIYMENSLYITVATTSDQGSSRISIQPGATVTLPKGNISLGSDLTVTGGTLNIGNNVKLTATSDAGALNIGSTDSAGTLQVDSAKLSNFISPSTGPSGHINLVSGSSLQVNGDTAVDLGKGVTFDSSDITVSGSNFIASQSIKGSATTITAKKLSFHYNDGKTSELQSITVSDGLDFTGSSQLKVNSLSSTGLIKGSDATINAKTIDLYHDSEASELQSITVSDVLNLSGSTQLKVDSLNATGAIKGASATIEAGKLDLNYSGDSEINTLKISKDLSLNGGAKLKVNSLSVDSTGTGSQNSAAILVGAAANTATTTTTTTAIMRTAAVNATPRATGSYAELSVENLDLADKSLVASADPSAPASIVAINNISSNSSTRTGSISTFTTTNALPRANTPIELNDSDLVALQNSIIGVGVADVASLRSVFSTTDLTYFGTNGELDNTDNVKSILYLAQPVSLGADGYLISDSTATQDNKALRDKVGTNNVYIGENSAVAVHLSAANDQNQAAIHIDKENASAKGGGQNSKIVIVGGATAQDLQNLNLFSDKNASDNSMAVKVAADGHDILVTTLSGRFSKVLKAGQSYSTVTLEKVGGSGGSQGGGTGSNPGSGGDGSTVLPPETSKPTHDATEDYIDDSVPNGEYNPVLDYTVLFDGSESTAETVARLGPYGGIAHSALAASNATYSSIATRMGLGAMRLDEEHLASNANGAVLWLNPLYRSSSSDDFANEGQGYGVDVDLYGVALGADVALNQSWRIGALFNVGSGSVDGSGAGAAVDNDFDYYSLGAYTAFTSGPLTLVGDVSYTAVSNDVSATTQASSIGKVGADIDSSSFSLGLTSKFDWDLGRITLSPHVGMRYTHLAVDDYDVTGHETYASFAAQSMDVFSVPVGVMLATDIAAGDWQVQPALDLTITPHLGDNELKGDVIWAGISNHVYPTVTEVLDDVTYGATLGIAASNGALSFGLSLNYTGSSNTDELGLQAHARLAF